MKSEKRTPAKWSEFLDWLELHPLVRSVGGHLAPGIYRARLVTRETIAFAIDGQPLPQFLVMAHTGLLLGNLGFMFLAHVPKPEWVMLEYVNEVPAVADRAETWRDRPAML
jgi:hypothetical protein